MVFTANFATNHGAGLYAEGGAPIIHDCEFVANVAGSGGGIYVDGGSTPRIDQCLVHDNMAIGPGGGIAVEGDASPFITGCTISRNVGGDGGGVYVGAARATIEFSVIKENTSEFGAGVSLTSCDEVVISSVLLTGNQATVWGGAVSAAYTAFRIERATIAGNRSSGDAVMLLDGLMALTDCIVEGNEAASVFSLEGYCEAGISFCDIWGNEGTLTAGSPLPGFGVVEFVNANGDSCDVYGNLFLNPVFMDPAHGDFHLDFSSPCIDAGNPLSAPDQDGSVADMGAFPAALPLLLTAQRFGSQLQLSWSACAGSAYYWVYGAVHDVFFAPGYAPGFEHRLAVLPAPTREWTTDAGVGDPEQEWAFVVLALSGTGWELTRSNRAGERDFALTIAP